jgi:protein-tyrosine phosphatase
MNMIKYSLLMVVMIAVRFIGNAQSLKVERIKKDTYLVDEAIVDNNKVTWNSLPDSWGKAKPIVLKTGHDTVVLASAHPIMKREEKKKAYYASSREIVLEGAANFRDLGGYATKDGRQMRWGKIYRSADISKLTDNDVRILSELNIKMVCDLRGEKEAELAPDRLPAGAERMLLSAGSENIGGQASFMKYMKTPASADSMIRSVYTRTDHLGKKYKPVFDQLFILENDKALLFHCTAGKDRTGVGAALILYSLGVSDSVIYKDYELTNEYRKQVNEQFVKMLAAQGLPEASGRSMMAANPEYLKAAFDAIKKQYGSVDSFLDKEIGLTADRKKELAKKLLY